MRVGFLKTVSANGSRADCCFRETLVESMLFDSDAGWGDSPSNVTTAMGADRLNKYLSHEGLCVRGGRLGNLPFFFGVSSVGDAWLLGAVG